ncbi:MAG: hypothetical protein LIO62_03390 [Clostridiales bacterium]|nr:hypothetical protein [Clostridiales bacterium]
MMKRLFSLILSLVVLVCSCNIAATAYCDENENQSVTPIVVIPGVGSSALYLDPNTENQSSAISVGGDFVKSLFSTHIVKNTLDMVIGKDVSAEIWTNKLSTLIEPFTVLNYTQDGESVGNIGIDCYWTDSLANHTEYLDSRTTAEPAVCKVLCDEVGAENVWLFNYDFREDVIRDAEQLAEFIDGVKEQSGSDKVALVGCSLGTCVLSVYIDYCGERDDIERAVFLDGAMQGVGMAKLFKQDIIIDKEILLDYINTLADDYKGTAADFSSIAKVFGLFDSTVTNVVDFLNEVTNDENIDRFYERVILPIIGNIPSLWECIPYDDFDECVSLMVSNGWLDTTSNLYSTINEYHAVQGRLEDNLKELQKNGVQVAIVCGYGLPGIPVTSAYDNTADMLIDTCYASFGATTSSSSNPLENATSADGLIDTSSCKFEENTWFLKGVQHMEFVYGTDMNDFVGYICTTDTPLDIASVEKDSQYTQFMELQTGGTTLANVAS